MQQTLKNTKLWMYSGDSVLQASKSFGFAYVYLKGKSLSDEIVACVFL